MEMEIHFVGWKGPFWLILFLGSGECFWWFSCSFFFSMKNPFLGLEISFTFCPFACILVTSNLVKSRSFWKTQFRSLKTHLIFFPNLCSKTNPIEKIAEGEKISLWVVWIRWQCKTHQRFSLWKPIFQSKNTSNALAVNPPTLNSATTTTTISPSPATSARTAAATGPRAALSATFLWVAAAARTPSAPPTPNALLLLPLRRRCLLRRCRPLQTLLLRSPSPPESTLRRRTRTEECSTSAEVSALSWPRTANSEACWRVWIRPGRFVGCRWVHFQRRRIRIRIRVELRQWSCRATAIQRAFWVSKLEIQTVGMAAMAGLISPFTHLVQPSSRERTLSFFFVQWWGRWWEWRRVWN